MTGLIRLFSFRRIRVRISYMGVMMDFMMKELPEAMIPEAMNLVWRVFSEYEKPVYPREGVQVFWDFIQTNSIREQCNNGMQIWGAFCGANLAGILASRNRTHICLLFVEKEYHRRGIAKKLFQTFLASLGDLTAPVTVNSSPYAVPVYQKLGFTAAGPEQIDNGIIFRPMQYIPIVK
jgi:GNAT superfamily N-acetyltransferase